MKQNEFIHDLIYKKMYLLQEKIEFNKNKYITFININIKKKKI